MADRERWRDHIEYQSGLFNSETKLRAPPFDGIIRIFGKEQLPGLPPVVGAEISWGEVTGRVDVTCVFGANDKDVETVGNDDLPLGHADAKVIGGKKDGAGWLETFNGVR